MRKICGTGLFSFVLLLMTIAFCGNLQAQDTDDDYNFDDIPVDDYRDLDYVGFGGGYLGMYSLVNFDELNKITARFGMEDFSNGMLLNGGGGFLGGIGIKNLRYGIYALSGSKEMTSSIKGSGDTSYTRTLRFTNGLVAAQLDYAIFLPPDGLMLFPGVMVGRGTNSIEVHQVRSSGAMFDELLDPAKFEGTSTDTVDLNRYSQLSHYSLHLQPTLNIEYAINQFILLRAGAGYGLNFTGKWTDASGTEVLDVPDINSSGLNIHFGLFVGLFQK